MNLLRPLTAITLLVLCTAGLVAAQAPGDALAAQSLRPYLHVFAAYAVAWLLIGGWIISIHRRLGKLERPKD